MSETSDQLPDCFMEVGACAGYLLEEARWQAKYDKLEKALVFYAEPKNWDQVYIASKGFSVSETLCDGGRIAREALS